MDYRQILILSGMSYELRDKRSRKPSSRHPQVNIANYIPYDSLFGITIRYVDDSVSPEEIMKKFEELEAIQKKKADIAKAVRLRAGHHF